MIYILLTHSSFKFGVTGGCRSLSEPVSFFFSSFFVVAFVSVLFDRRAITGAICKMTSLRFGLGFGQDAKHTEEIRPVTWIGGHGQWA